MWAFQQNIYKTKTSEPIPPETFTINSEGSTAQIRLRSPYNVDWGDGTNDDVLSAVSGNYNSPIHNYGSSATRTITITPTSGVLTSVTYLQFLTGELDNPISFLNQLPSLVTFTSGSGDMSGDMFSITAKPTLKSINIGANSTVSGNISSLSSIFPNIEDISIGGINTLTGSISSSINLSSLNKFDIFGSNTLSGDISGIHVNLEQIRIFGSNTISGNLSSLTTKTSLYSINIQGSNTITGDIINVPSQIQEFIILGNNTISGNTSNLILSNMRSINIAGSNTITGLVEDLPTLKGSVNGQCQLLISGSNTISGNIANYEISDVSSTTRFAFDIRGNNSIGFTLPSSSNWSYLGHFYLYPAVGEGLTSTEVDNLLIDMDSGVLGGGSGSRIITLVGSNAARTSASDAAVASLISKGYTVTTN